jgi:hypothetical protein
MGEEPREMGYVCPNSPVRYVRTRNKL